MATAAALQKAIATNEKYAVNYRKAGKDPSKYIAKITALKAELAQVSASKTEAVPATSGLTNYTAAQSDAVWVLRAASGNTVGADTNPAPGAAKTMGFSGVMSDDSTGSWVYGVFENGVLTGTSATNPGAGPAGFTPFGLASGIDKDAPYTGPGALRP